MFDALPLLLVSELTLREAAGLIFIETEVCAHLGLRRVGF